jgi:hypothetical protein
LKGSRLTPNDSGMKFPIHPRDQGQFLPATRRSSDLKKTLEKGANQFTFDALMFTG